MAMGHLTLFFVFIFSFFYFVFFTFLVCLFASAFVNKVLFKHSHILKYICVALHVSKQEAQELQQRPHGLKPLLLPGPF